MIIDYNAQKTFVATLVLEDAGNFFIRCNGEDIFGNPVEYYMGAKTEMGKVEFIKFGPVLADLPALTNGFDLSTKKINFKETAIEKEINLFINDGKKRVSEAVEITEDEFFAALPTIGFNFI